MDSETFNELKETLEYFEAASYNAAQGVVRLEGKKPGPHVGVTICTHGNEPVGLAAAQSLINLSKEGAGIECGSVYLVLNNLEAVRRYFRDSDNNGRYLSRYVDVDMNRLPADVFLKEDSREYEAKRAQELQPVWESFEYALDIHSTTLPAEPFVVNLEQVFQKNLIHGFPIQKIISNIHKVQTGCPVTHFYGTDAKKAVSFGIECGSHENERSFEYAKISALAFLQNVGLASSGIRNDTHAYEEYDIFDSIVFPDTTYSLVRLFNNFEFVPKGTVFAKGNGEDIVAPYDCHTLFASKLKPEHIEDEVLFLTRPPTVVTA